MRRCALLLFAPIAVEAQPLLNPYPFQPAYWETIETRWLSLPQFSMSSDTGWLQVRDGDFVDSRGNPIRFVGAVLNLTACFPDSATAIRVASRLRALGFNAVALRGIDISTWNAASILRPGTTSSALDSQQMRRLDWFIAQLKRQGFRILLMLHSLWTPRREDGVARWDSIPWGGKAVLYIDPAFQRRYRQIVRMFMEHVNPYTGRAYKDEPAIAWVLLSDENSLFYYWTINYLHRPASTFISEHHSRQLDTLFNLFLRRKYGSDAAVRSAWFTPPADTQNGIRDGGFEDEFNPSWVFGFNGAVAQALYRPSELDKREGRYAALVRIARTDGSPGSVYLYTGTRTVFGRLYELSFWARASHAPRRIRFLVYNGEFPYQGLGLSIDTALTATWQEYRFRFRASDSAAAARLLFYFGQDTGDVFLDAVQLRMLNEVPLRTGESLLNFSIARSLYNDLVGTSLPRMRDNVEFYTELQREYYESMYRLLRDTLKYRGIIIGGTLLSRLNDLWSMQRMDATAELAGWDYRRNRSQPQGSWFIANTPMLGHLYGGTIAELAHAAVRNKPTLAFYIMPFPSAHMGEMVTLIPAYAAYHGWDAVFFLYGADAVDSYSLPMIAQNRHYDLWANSAVMCLVPSASAAYRAGLISPARETIWLNQTRHALLHPHWQQSQFWLQYSTDHRIALFRRVVFDSLSAQQQTMLPHRYIPELTQSPIDVSNLLSDTEELLWNARDTLFTVSTPRYIAATGRLRGILQFGDIRVERLDSGYTGTISWLSLDTARLDSARWSLLTLSTRACNDSAIWEGNVSIWQGWGKAPVLLEGMRVRLSWRSSADTIRVYGLDSTGRLAFGPLEPVRLPNGRVSLTIDQSLPLQRTPWFVIEQVWRRPEPPPDTTEDTTGTRVLPPSIVELPILHLFGPQPVRDDAAVEFWLPPTLAPAALELVTPTGDVRTLWHGQSDGTWRILHLPSLASGTYWLTLRSGTLWQRKAFVVLR
ncbi:MAG: carbohydrate binding domain-containing protein [Candidatus Kapabacteria bacterium]|nr:carbohydrate binding domain-containing protein [Candidatus Kapabacteria bacterium]MDW8012667.1 carbohydrate binding domain-containing protein [Bacteroidota bacterium]